MVYEAGRLILAWWLEVCRGRHHLLGASTSGGVFTITWAIQGAFDAPGTAVSGTLSAHVSLDEAGHALRVRLRDVRLEREAAVTPVQARALPPDVR